MTIHSIMQCDRRLDFHPRRDWPRALPALAWQGLLLTGFERTEGQVLDLWENGRCPWLEAVKAAHPELGLGELSRLQARLIQTRPELAKEFNDGLLAEYGLRWCERLQETMQALASTPLEFQNWVDEKGLAARDLSPLLAVGVDVAPFLMELPRLGLSKSQGVQALEWFVELLMMGQPLNDLMPSTDGAAYLRRLEQWRKPAAADHDQRRQRQVAEWPWPAHVQGQWQRFGDQSGLEIKIRATSPQDLHKKLERLGAIQETWSCEN
jgi:hypothetical protein